MMKPFDLEEAKAGKPVCTRVGDKARIICFDKKGATHPLIALVEDADDGEEMLETYKIDGRYSDDDERDSVYDLFMAPSIQCWWVAVYSLPNGDVVAGRRLYPTLDAALKYSNTIGRVCAAKIEWEE